MVTFFQIPRALAFLALGLEGFAGLRDNRGRPPPGFATWLAKGL